MRTMLASALGAGLLLAASPASAQSQCADGRVATAQTAGRCCWPGQTWARDLGRCDGPPACPTGYAAQGDDCVARTPTAAPNATGTVASVSTATYAPTVVATPVYMPMNRHGRYVMQEPYRGGPVPPNARIEDRRRGGAFAFGMIFASIGISAAIYEGVALAATSYSTGNCSYYYPGTYDCARYESIPCGSTAWTAFIPVAGPLLAGITTQCSNAQGFLLALGTVGTVFELGGLLLAIYGRTTYQVLAYNHGGLRGRVDRSPRFSIVPFAAGADVGVTLGLSHF